MSGDASLSVVGDPCEPLRFGSWIAVRALSVGGSGIIYEARHAESGREAAVKTLRALRPDEQEGLRREILVLSRLDHSGVVRVYESGIEESLPWYAMELFRAPTLAERLLAQPRFSLERSLGVLRDLAETLSFLHVEGIVHRDLKPANVIMRGGESPVLVDFGLVSRTPAKDPREPLERGGSLVGTLAYIAPEQIRGERVDARADLYSLGCMIYEAVVGVPPFGHTGPDLVGRHLHEPAPPIPAAVAGERPDLARLVAALLEKDPHDRPGYAEDVARELSRFVPGIPPAARGPTPAYLYRPHLVGRGDAVDAIVRRLDRARGGAGSLLLVTGESGAGKTRLAQEATMLASSRGFEVVLGECTRVARGKASAGVPGAPLHPLAPLLRSIADHCRHEGRDATHAILGQRARTLVDYEPSLASIPGFDELPEPEPLSGDAASARAIAHLAETLRTFAERAPVLFVVDDLQWADQMTLNALRAFAVDLVPDVQLVLLGTARSDEMSDELHQLLTATSIQTIALERLGPDDIRSMVSDMLAIRRPPADLVSMLIRESGGNPFFVAEYLRAAVAGGFLQRSRGRWQMTARPVGEGAGGLEVGLPTTLQDVLEQRVALVPDEAISVLEAGAVLEREFDAALVARVAGVEPDEGIAAVAALARRHIFEETRGRLRFCHERLRGVAYDRIPEERRSGLHRSAARWIEERYRNTPELASRYSQLAHHTAVGGDAERAAYYFDLAAAHALDGGAYREAHAWLARAAELDDDGAPPDGDLRLPRRERLRSVAAFGIGDLAGCIQHGRRALNSLGTPLPRSRTAWSMALAGELARRVVRVVTPRRPPAAGDPGSERSREAALALAQLATSFFFAGSSLPTLVTVLRGLRHGESAGADRAIVEASMRLGFVSGTARLRRVSRHYFARAHRGADRIGDRRARALALYFEAMHGIGFGLWDRTREFGDRAAALLEEIGDTHEAEVALTIAAHGFFYAGDVAEADRRVAAVLDTATRRANAQHIGWGRSLRARTELVRGRPVEAFSLANSAREMVGDLPDTLSNVMLEGTLALSALHAGEVSDAIAACDRLLARLARGERPATGQCLDGLAGATDVLLCLRESGAACSEIPGFERSLARSAAALRGFSRIFPIAQPAALRTRARRLHARGRLAAARRSWRLGARAARRLGMPLEEARVYLDLARIGRGAGADEGDLRRALALLTPMGCEAFAQHALTASGG